MADSASDEKQISQRERKAKRDTEGINDAIRYFMGKPEGRLLIYWLLEEAHMYQTSFTGNSSTFFKEGERNIGLKLINRIHRLNCFDEYVSMLKEAELRKHNG